MDIFSSGLYFLDELSYRLNVPIHIESIVCHDIENRSITTNYVSPYKDVLLDGKHNDTVPLQLVPALSLYREAKNSQSYFYKFLCYYKILEGILKLSRPQASAKLKRLDPNFVFPKDLVPDHPQIVGKYKEYVGMPIHKFLEETLGPEFRDRIAHFGLKDNDPLLVSSMEERDSFAVMVLIVELCCRTVMESQKRILKQLIRLE